MAINKKADTSNISGDINIGFNPNKQKFTINGDLSKVIELDPSDIGIVRRLADAVPKLSDAAEQWESIDEVAQKVTDSDSMEDAVSSSVELSNKLNSLEKSVRKIVDDIFDSPVADTILGNTSVFSPVNGFYKYEHIINNLIKCYETRIQDEAPKFNSKKIHKYTNRYK